jgi:hypothetical protein
MMTYVDDSDGDTNNIIQISYYCGSFNFLVVHHLSCCCSTRQDRHDDLLCKAWNDRGLILYTVKTRLFILTLN